MEKIHAEGFDEAGIRQVAAAVAAAEADRAVTTARLLHEIRAVLNPGQQKQLQERLNQPASMMGERRPHRPGPAGPRPSGSGS